MRMWLETPAARLGLSRSLVAYPLGGLGFDWAMDVLGTICIDAKGNACAH
jgi:hypothetical protein